MNAQGDILPQSCRGAAGYATEQARWDALVRKDRAADGQFVYAVKTTGIYCRPCCPSRLAHRGHVVFFQTGGEAELAGFRPCRRCRPDGVGLAERHAQTVSRVCAYIEKADTPPDLQTLAQAVGVSPFHLHRLFRRATGLTPKAYAHARRAQRMRDGLPRSDTVTETIYGSGYNSNGRFYAESKHLLGMTPLRFKKGGRGETIRFAIGECSLGSILVAASAKGVCAILMGDDPDALVQNLQQRFEQAHLVGGDAGFEQTVAAVVGLVETPRIGLDLPLDIRGTAFQQRVWDALRAIPVGSTASYADIARKIGSPQSVRAVAGACAANALAVAIPCHRVVRTDGGLSGYRWGVERKRSLLERESAPGVILP